MPALLKHINQQMPSAVPVIKGAAEELVKMRELRTKYQTNRAIKTWSCWFLLKALTSSSKIQQWIHQKEFLLQYVQMNEKTFRQRLKEMLELQLITIEDGNICLISYEKAAHSILDIAYTGLIYIDYNPIKNEGNQIFQYFLRAEEFRYHQSRQLNALLYHLDKNPLLKSDLHLLLINAGADDQRLYKEPRYYQERLLQLQMKLFKEGSELLGHIYVRRADINRGINRIKEHHAYKSKQSVSYLKKRMFTLGVVQVKKICVESEARSRLFYTEGDKVKDGYKYVPRSKRTAWFLTDQINFLYESTVKKRGRQMASNAA